MTGSTAFFDKMVGINAVESASSLCIICKGARKLCGKDRCPLMIKFYSQSKTIPLLDSRDLEGSSPPAVFVGRFGYPKVDIGPLLPPEFGDTSVMDTPEMWVGKTIDDIVDFRFRLVRGKFRIDARNFRVAGRIVDQVQELALTEKPVDVEANFSQKPRGRVILDDEVQPFGPSARMEQMNVGNGRFQRCLEKSFYDTDMKSVDAVVSAYKNGTLISEIQKAFSVGTMGIDKNRRFVPTRWSITAVDDIIGKNLLKDTKYNNTIDEFRIYQWEELDNRWCIMMMPCTWRFELIEAWYPNTTWNPTGKQIEMISDCEFFDGRSEYAHIGGCYYASRMAVNELLTEQRRTAGVVIFREAHPGYVMPVGVWNVRENVRAALKTRPFKFDTLEEALTQIEKVMDIPRRTWLKHSGVLRDYMTQRRIEDYLQPV
ncbi:MAG: Nre family DNA repair protein [Candidatus Methanomethylophilaceae archaeon]